MDLATKYANLKAAADSLAEAVWLLTSDDDEIGTTTMLLSVEQIEQASNLMEHLGAPANIRHLLKRLWHYLTTREAQMQLDTAVEHHRHVDTFTNEQAVARGVTIVGKQRWMTVCKASHDSGWFKTTKAMAIEGGLGVLVQTCTREINGSPSEALVFVPSARLVDNGDGTGTLSW
jgi:hypothetical protein